MKITLSALLLLLWTGAAAQNRRPVKAGEPYHRLAVNFNPLTLVKADQLLMFGVERRFNKRWAVVGDAGAIVHSSYLQEEHKASGFELRPGFRYYYGRNATGYIQGQFNYRLASYRMHGWLGKDCVDGVPAYEQLQDFTFRKQHLGAAFIVGAVDQITPRFLVDYSVGLGVQHRTQKLAGNVDGCFQPRTSMFRNPDQTNVLIPMMPISVKIAYVIR